MSDLATERKHLEQANGHIADGERRVAAQIELIGRLHAARQNTEDAESLLRTLQGVLSTWNDHRDQILGEIARLEQAVPD